MSLELYGPYRKFIAPNTFVRSVVAMAPEPDEYEVDEERLRANVAKAAGADIDLAKAAGGRDDVVLRGFARAFLDRFDLADIKRAFNAENAA